MKYLFILNDSPYGMERSYHGPRLVRGLGDGDLTRGCARSIMAQLTDWAAWAEKTFDF